MLYRLDRSVHLPPRYILRQLYEPTEALGILKALCCILIYAAAFVFMAPCRLPGLQLLSPPLFASSYLKTEKQPGLKYDHSLFSNIACVKTPWAVGARIGTGMSRPTCFPFHKYSNT